MSYTKIYNAMFTKLSDGKYIPMVQAGASNVYTSSGKRSRGWQPFHDKGYGKFLTLSDIEKLLQDYKEKYETKRNADNSDGSFGYYMGVAVGNKSTYNTTYNDFKNMIMRGVKNAVSVDVAISDYGLNLSYFDKDSFILQHEHFDNEGGLLQCFSEHKDRETYFLYDDVMADSKVAELKAVKGAARKGKDNPFIIKCSVSEDDGAKFYYITIEDGKFAVTDNKERAHIFTKRANNGAYTMDLVFKYVKGLNLAMAEELF